MKICNKCKRKLDLSEFSLNVSKKDGHNYTCKECHKIFAKAHYSSNKQYYRTKAIKSRKKMRIENLLKLNNYKSSKSCKFCGENNAVCLDLHHRESEEKEYCISEKLSSMSWSRLSLEIEKCDVVCANCHRKIHAGLLFD